VAICLYLWDSQKQAQCQKRNREAKTERIETRQGGRTERTETRQGGRTDRTESRQGGRSDRVETRVEGGATLGQGLAGLGAGVGSFLTGAPPPGTVAGQAGGISPTVILVGAAGLAAALLLTGDKK